MSAPNGSKPHARPGTSCEVRTNTANPAQEENAPSATATVIDRGSRVPTRDLNPSAIPRNARPVAGVTAADGTPRTGSTRARLPAELDQPATVSHLAARLGITVAAASQHLDVLRATGLVFSRREGRKVVSLHTDLGPALVEGDNR
ncbi:hypothetical protein SUDANB95_02574 [Actinosynnema sp. ALI-1.44]